MLDEELAGASESPEQVKWLPEIQENREEAILYAHPTDESWNGDHKRLSPPMRIVHAPRPQRPVVVEFMKHENGLALCQATNPRGTPHPPQQAKSAE